MKTILFTAWFLLSAHSVAADDILERCGADWQCVQREEKLDAQMDQWDHRHDKYTPPAAPTISPKRGDRAALIHWWHNARYQTGDILPADKIKEIFFLDEPCSLDLADKRGLHRAWIAYREYQVGCWYNATGERYGFIGQLDSFDHFEDAIYPRALLHADGSATITEPNYDSATFAQLIFAERWKRLRAHANEAP